VASSREAGRRRSPVAVRHKGGHRKEVHQGAVHPEGARTDVVHPAAVHRARSAAARKARSAAARTARAAAPAVAQTAASARTGGRVADQADQSRAGPTDPGRL